MKWGMKLGIKFMMTEGSKVPECVCVWYKCALHFQTHLKE